MVQWSIKSCIKRGAFHTAGNLGICVTFVCWLSWRQDSAGIRTLYKDIQMKERWPVVVVVVLTTFYSDADPWGSRSAELPATMLGSILTSFLYCGVWKLRGGRWSNVEIIHYKVVNARGKFTDNDDRYGFILSTIHSLPIPHLAAHADAHSS